MLPVKKRYVLGFVICGAAAYFSARWLYYYYTKSTNEDENEPPEPLVDTKNNKRLRKSTSRSMQSLKSLNNHMSSSSTWTMNKDYNNFNSAASVTSSWTARTSNMVFYDVEPNLHFFKIYQDQLAIVDSIPMPRNDRTLMFCESQEEYLAKVACLRNAFQDILYEKENCTFFIDCGREILENFLSNSPNDLQNCLRAYQDMLEYVGDESNFSSIAAEIKARRIPVLSFYDLVIDYIILESLDDLESPPAVISSILSNKWVSAKFRQSACLSAVTTALKYKRSQLKCQKGFFALFYSVLDHLSPTLAWGFLGSDEELQARCEFLRESLLGLCSDYFSFDRVRYTNYQDLKSDIMTITRERYLELTDRLIL